MDDETIAVVIPAGERDASQEERSFDMLAQEERLGSGTSIPSREGRFVSLRPAAYVGDVGKLVNPTGDGTYYVLFSFSLNLLPERRCVWLKLRVEFEEDNLSVMEQFPRIALVETRTTEGSIGLGITDPISKVSFEIKAVDKVSRTNEISFVTPYSDSDTDVHWIFRRVGDRVVDAGRQMVGVRIRAPRIADHLNVKLSWEYNVERDWFGWTPIKIPPASTTYSIALR